MDDEATQDHLVADVLRLRLVDPPRQAAERVRSVFGTTAVAPSGSADLTITFVDELAGPDLRLIGRDRSAFDADRFYAVERTAKGRALLSIPFEAIGVGLELVGERAVRTLPGLVPIANLVMLSKGIVPLHGSAFTWSGLGIVAAGWSKGGKTETLLAFTSDGAAAVADEWTYLAPDRSITGAAEPIRLEVTHLEARPELRDAVPSAARRRLAVTSAVAAAHGAVYERHPAVPGSRVADALMPAVRARQAVTVSPRRLFGDRYAGKGRLDRVVLLVTSTTEAPVVRRVDAAHVVERMAVAHQHHRLDLVARYYESRFAFPDRRSELLDHVEDRERTLLAEALADVPCSEARLPHPPTIDALHDALASHLAEAP